MNKLCNGLLKISDTREKVEGMTVELEEAKKQVAEFQKQCEDYLTVILEQKREADRHQKVKLHKRSNTGVCSSEHCSISGTWLLSISIVCFFVCRWLAKTERKYEPKSCSVKKWLPTHRRI